MDLTLKFACLTLIALAVAVLSSLAQDIESFNVLTATTTSGFPAYPFGVSDNRASFEHGAASVLDFNDSNATPEVVPNGLSSPIGKLRIDDGDADNGVSGRASGSVSIFLEHGCNW